MLMLLLLVALVAAFVAFATRTRRPDLDVLTRLPGRDATGGLEDARAEARRLVDRLGAGIGLLDGVPPVDPAREQAARAALAEASERHAAARSALLDAATPHQVALASRSATEGLYALRSARIALGIDPGAPVEAAAAPVTDSERWAVLDGQEYRYSPRPGAGTPYYYGGGTVAGRQVPAGWYSTPWWKTALVAGAAGLGGVLVADALFGAMSHHGPGLFGGPHHGGPFGGGPFGGGPFGGGPMDGPMGGPGGFLDGF